jgi:hypothetical protein
MCLEKSKRKRADILFHPRFALFQMLKTFKKFYFPERPSCPAKTKLNESRLKRRFL